MKIKRYDFSRLMGFFALLMFVLIYGACESKAVQKNSSEHKEDTFISTSNADKTLTAADKYELAKKSYEKNKTDADALIWFGRRAAYLGNYDEAIQTYSKGIDLHPNDARMYRHRGHRYISTRQYDKAIADFEKAVELIKDKKDEVEPDGLPNSRNIPISTLHGNIWYHLGLAYYLKNDMDNALKAYSNRTVTEKYDDNIVSGGHWLYMILSRKGMTDEADAVLEKVDKEMDIIENFSYHQMCLFYKGMISEDALNSEGLTSSGADVFNYGLGNWYLYKKKDTLQAKKYYRELLEKGNKYSFAYLAGESDWERLFKNESISKR